MDFPGKKWNLDTVWEEGKRKQCDVLGSVLLGKLESFHVDVALTCATYLNSFADQVHPFIETVLPNGRMMLPAMQQELVRNGFRLQCVNLNLIK